MSAIPRFEETEPVFEDTEPIEETGVSIPGSLALGAAQGATLGFGDEAEAAIRTAYEANKERMGGSRLAGAAETAIQAVSPAKLISDFVLEKVRRRAAGGPPLDVQKPFGEALDTARARNAEAKEAHPTAFGAGEFVGAIPAAATVPLRAGALAALGGVQAAGMSNPATPGELAGDAVKGSLIGLAFGAVGPRVGKAVKSVGKRAISTVFGPSLDAIEARLKNPEAIRNAPAMSDLAGKLPGTLNKLAKKIGLSHDKAVETLSTSKFLNEGALPKEELLKDILAARRALSPIITPDDETAARALGRVAENIKKQPGQTISQKQLGGWIRRLDDSINWDNVNASNTNSALKSVRVKWDQALKDTNQNYRQAMVPVDEQMRLLEDVSKNFSVKMVPGAGRQETNATISALKSTPLDTKSVSRRALERLAGETGEDFATQAQNARYASEFQGGGTQGSRRVALGSIVGGGTAAAGASALGISPGAVAAPAAVAGAIVGANIDKEGGRYAGNIIDFYLKTNPQRLGKYASILGRAAARGGQAVAIQNYVLQQRDPEYHTMIQGLESETTMEQAQEDEQPQ